jgi:hypothetical protein
MKLVLFREGEFVPVNMRENLHRCANLGVFKFRYAIEIEATDDRLSKEGFVVEQSRLHNYWLTRYCSGKPWNAMSCENMAIKAAMEIGRTLYKEGISVIAVKVTMFGAEGAKIDARWSLENDPPKGWKKKPTPRVLRAR